MAPRDTEVGKDEVIVRRPADTQPAGGQWQHRGGPPVHAQPVVLLRLDAPAAAPAAAPVGAVAGRAAVAARGTVAARAAVARGGGTRAGNVRIRNVRARGTRDGGARGTRGRDTRGGGAALPAADVAGPIVTQVTGLLVGVGELLAADALVRRQVTGRHIAAEVVTAADTVAAGLVLNRSVVQHGGAGLAAGGERAGVGRRYLGGCMHGAGGRLAAQYRAILGITEPDHAIGTDGDPVHAAGPDKRPVCTSRVLKYPCVLFVPERRMTPRHARVGQDDIGARIPAQLVRGPRVQSVVRLPRAHHKYRASPRRAGTQR